MICIAACWKCEILSSDSWMDQIARSLPVMLHLKTHYYEITYKRPTITHSLSLFPAPLSVKCLNPGLTWVTSQCWSEPFAHCKLIESKCFFCWQKQFHSLVVDDTHAAVCADSVCLQSSIVEFLILIGWWVLRLLINFLFFVTGLLMPSQFYFLIFSIS